MQWDELYPKLHSFLEEPSWPPWLVLHEHNVQLFRAFIDCLSLAFCVFSQRKAALKALFIVSLLRSLGTFIQQVLRLPTKLLGAQDEICGSCSSLCFLIVHSSLHNTVCFYWPHCFFFQKQALLLGEVTGEDGTFGGSSTVSCIQVTHKTLTKLVGVKCWPKRNITFHTNGISSEQCQS